MPSPNRFCKMHGLGNDFVVLNCLDTPFSWQCEEIVAAARRHTGIGFDQLLIIEPPDLPTYDFSYRIFNADGSEVEHCGNGARCFGKYLRDHQLFDFSRAAKVSVKKGQIEISYVGKRHGEDCFRVDMGTPDFSPFTTCQDSALAQSIEIDGRCYSFGLVSMGNPHAVMTVPDCAGAAVAEIGGALQNHPLFPQQVNVGFMQKIDRSHIYLRVFERGVGETQACGTGACAAVAVGIARDELDRQVEVSLTGGVLEIDWAGGTQPLFMSGPAQTVFHGQLP